MSGVVCNSTQAPEVTGQNLRELKKECAILLNVATQLHTLHYEEND